MTFKINARATPRERAWRAVLEARMAGARRNVAPAGHSEGPRFSNAAHRQNVAEQSCPAGAHALIAGIDNLADATSAGEYAACGKRRIRNRIGTGPFTTLGDIHAIIECSTQGDAPGTASVRTRAAP